MDDVEYCNISKIDIINSTCPYNASFGYSLQTLYMKDVNNSVVEKLLIRDVLGNDSGALAIQVGAGSFNNTFSKIDVINISSNSSCHGIQVGTNSDNNSLDKILIDDISGNTISYGFYIAESNNVDLT